MSSEDQQRIVPVSINGDDWLACPSCQNTYGLHQYKYRISNPESHDKKSVIVDGCNLAHHDSKGWSLDDHRPRESIEIKFWCECCGRDDMKLQILQHKGMTLVHWGKFK